MKRSYPTPERMQQVLGASLAEVMGNMILPLGSGYEAFGNYVIQPVNDEWQVQRSRRDPLAFSSSRTALAWCIADKLRQTQLSMDIQRLDAEKTAITADITARARLRGRMRASDLAEAVDVKLETRRQRLAGVEATLTKCVNQAKYLQIRGFNNETARAGRTSPHRTNR